MISRLTRLRATPSTLCFKSTPQIRSAFLNQKPIRGFSGSTFKEKPRLYGQPLPHTHPHLFPNNKSNEDRHVVVIIPSSPTKYMSYDIPYNFHQYNDFLYLTGFKEPDSAVIIEKRPGSAVRTTLFVQKRDPKRELWDGPRTGTDATDIFGVDETVEWEQFPSHLTHILKYNGDFDFFYVPKIHPGLDSIYAERIRNYSGPIRAMDPTNLFHKLRLIKTPSEIQLMRESGRIAAEAMTETMSHTNETSLITEHELSAFMEYRMKKRGASWFSYPPVVAGGNNANTLHYIANDMPLNRGDLVLIDAGAEVNGYVSDITRTWPVSGRFSEGQREIYEVVLECNKKCIQLCRADGSSLRSIHGQAVSILSEGLHRLGLIRRASDPIDEFFPHSIGHWLGMDTHDVHSISTSTPLRPSMVVTIEPGLYIPHKPSIPHKYRGIGIRIEDNVLVTDGAPEVLTAAVPKEVEDIERMELAQFEAWLEARNRRDELLPSLQTSRRVASDLDLAMYTAAQRRDREEFHDESCEIHDFMGVNDHIETPSILYTDEIKIYLERHTRSKIIADPNEDIMLDKINLEDDKRFSKETNEMIRRDLYRRVHDIKYKIYKSMGRQLEELNKKGIFDEKTNHARIRSLFKVKIQQLAGSIHQLHAELVQEMEKKRGLEHKELNVLHQNRKSREQGSAFLREIRRSSTASVYVPSRQRSISKMTSMPPLVQVKSNEDDSFEQEATVSPITSRKTDPTPRRVSSTPDRFERNEKSNGKRRDSFVTTRVKT
ncbi:putative Xaa-Pro aminopeptidase 3 [Planoprotostelium fungivorum]|uniref:Putative Xaa-Pro aminopeptidase 3 n=1 Tax=Planoprotostelium fungivorum TaxID=1890364 RepID=A0A2P6NUF5_9EUKA|nr:putative Xaa-Pro aminopeptidase 3 [Planoprotostelium fungivorum]